MQILFLADAVFQDVPGGSRVAARELARGLTKRGHAVTFLVARQGPAPPDEETQDGVRIVRYRGAGHLRQFVREGRKAAARLCAQTPFDIVHTHFAYAAVGPLQGVPPDVPRVRSFYGPWDEEGWVEDRASLDAASFSPIRRGIQTAKILAVRAVRRRVEENNLRGSRVVLILSEQSRGEARARGVPEARLVKVPGGADTTRFDILQDKASVRRRLGWPEDRRIILSVRRLAARMGLDNLIRAMSGVATRFPDVLLLIGGKGPEAGRLQELVNALRLKDHVRLLGFIPDADLAGAYGAADVFALPTVALEGFGLVTMESLSCGVPVLGTPVGATPELLRALEPRLVTAGVGPDALAENLCAFLERPEWVRALTPARLRAFVQANYTWERHVDGTEQAYRSLQGMGHSAS